LVVITIVAGMLMVHCGGGANDSIQQTHELLNAVLWMQASAEYEVACLQSFALARRNLAEALADSEWTAIREQQDAPNLRRLPPAVIVDVDETVLSNSRFDARTVTLDTQYDPALWDEWVAKSNAEPIPGSVRFVEYAGARGVEVFFVTNRKHHGEAATLRNLQSVFGAGIDTTRLLCRGDRDDWRSRNKSPRREYLAGKYRILLLIGDDLNDFVWHEERPPEGRKASALNSLEYWGTKWILIPNPMYGSWEEAIYGYGSGASRSDKLQAKYKALDDSW
jgi:acid phosphatase